MMEQTAERPQIGEVQDSASSGEHDEGVGWSGCDRSIPKIYDLLKSLYPEFAFSEGRIRSCKTMTCENFGSRELVVKLAISM